eukprot:sb/3477864/
MMTHCVGIAKCGDGSQISVSNADSIDLGGDSLKNGESGGYEANIQIILNMCLLPGRFIKCASVYGVYVTVSPPQATLYNSTAVVRDNVTFKIVPLQWYYEPLSRL